MAWRFQKSKFANIQLKPLESGNKISPYLFHADIPAANAYSNLVATSGYLYAYLADANQIGIDSSLNQKPKNLMKFYLSNLVDFSFSPFHDDILGALSTTGQLRLNRIPIEPDFDSEFISYQVKHNDEAPRSLLDIPLKVNDKELRTFHFCPTIESLVAVTSIDSIQLFDIRSNNPSESISLIASSELTNIQSIDFEYEGRLVVANSLVPGAGEAFVKLFDLRQPDSSKVAASFIKTGLQKAPKSQSRVVYLDGANLPSCGHILSVDRTSFGFDLSVWDVRSGGSAVAVTSIDAVAGRSSNSVKLPLYDYDTGLLFVATRNESLLEHFEAEKLIKSGYNGSETNRIFMADKILGASLASKRSLDFKNVEVDRVVTLHSSYLQSCLFQVPRKMHSIFPEDLYPPTKSPHAPLQKIEDLNLIESELVGKLTLDPSLIKVNKLFAFSKNILHTEEDNIINTEIETTAGESKIQPAKPILKPKPAPKVTYNPKFAAGPKFKYLVGNLAGREEHFVNLASLSRKIPLLMECFQADRDYAFYPVGEKLNELAVVPLDRPGKLTSEQTSLIRVGGTIGFFALERNEGTRLAVARGKSLLIYDLQSDMPTNTVVEKPNYVVEADNVISMFQFHPWAKGLLAFVVIGDERIQFVDYLSEEDGGKFYDSITLPNQVLTFAFNVSESGGLKLAVLLKNGELWLVHKLAGVSGPGKLPTTGELKNGRVCWASSLEEDRYIVVTGFIGAQRCIFLFDSINLASGPVTTYLLDHSSASILVPTFDVDTKTLFLTGKGDEIIYAFEVNVGPEQISAERIRPLANFDLPGPHQAIVFLPKTSCNVRKLEFARGYRLTVNSIEPFGFTLPRLHMEYFHDDIFPPTVDRDSSRFPARGWFEASQAQDFPKISYIDMHPKDMELYSQNKDQLIDHRNKKAREAKAPLQSDEDRMLIFNQFADKFSIAQKCEDLIAQTSNLVAFDENNKGNAQLAEVEGVDSDEWED